MSDNPSDSPRDSSGTANDAPAASAPSPSPAPAHRRSASAAVSPSARSTGSGSSDGGGGTEQPSGALRASPEQEAGAQAVASEDRFLDVPTMRQRSLPSPSASAASAANAQPASAAAASDESSARSSRSASPREGGLSSPLSASASASHVRRSSFTLQASSPTAPATPVPRGGGGGKDPAAVFKAKTPAPIARSSATTPTISPSHAAATAEQTTVSAEQASAEQAAALQLASDAAAAALAAIVGDRSGGSAGSSTSPRPTSSTTPPDPAAAAMSATDASSIAMVFSAMAGARRPTMSGGEAPGSSGGLGSSAAYTPMYNENGVELEQPIVINPRTGKPKVKRQFARRYASMILAHVARENAAAATREAMEYRARKAAHLESHGEKHSWSALARSHKLEKSRLHGKKMGVADYFAQILATSDEKRKNEERRIKEELAAREARIKALLGEDPTIAKNAGAPAGDGDNSAQIESLHRAGNIFNAVLNADRKAVDALLRANPHVLSQRGPVGELPLHMAFLYNTPAHSVLAFYIMSLCPHVIAEPYWGTEYTGENILHIAIIQQDPRMVQRLVAKEPALLSARATGHFFQQGQPCYYGEWPLSFAACTGQTSIVSFLISAGADLEAQDSNGNNVLHLMVLHNRPEMYSLCKAKWTELNALREPGCGRCTGERVLWKRRNKEGFTPMTLSAKIGSANMFGFLLEEEKQKQWAYGPISCYVYPLEQIDMPLAITPQEKALARKQAQAEAAGAGLSPSASSSSSSSSSSADDDDSESSLMAQQPRALELIVNEAHLDLLMHPRMIELIKQKWQRFAQRIFFRRFMVVLLYLALFTACCIHRQTENILGIERWGLFEDRLTIYKNQSAHYAALGAEREQMMHDLERHAIELAEQHSKDYERNVTMQSIKKKQTAAATTPANATQAAVDATVLATGAAALDSNTVLSTAADLNTSLPLLLSPPSLDALRADLLRKLSLSPIPSVVHLDGLDIPRLEAMIARENEKAASRESAGIAKRKRREEDWADGQFGEGMRIDVAAMSQAELAVLLTPPEMLYDDGVLGGLFDLLAELAWSPPVLWGSILWRYPCFLLLGELVVVAGALYKGNNELGELHERGINNYLGAAGSAFFENSLSLLFSTLMLVVLILSLTGSYQVRMVLSLCSMVGYSYIFFFLLAFRMTGPMIVMIYQMLTSDVVRFLAVFSVFLLAFAQAFYVLFDADGFTGFIHSIQSCFLAMLGDFDFATYYESATTFKLITIGMLVAYVIVVTILLLNLLIAMMGSTYNKINEAAEMQWHLERARIVFAIEHEMGEEERGAKANKYWTVIGGKRFLQVLVENPDHFRTRKVPPPSEEEIAAAAAAAAADTAAVDKAAAASCASASSSAASSSQTR